MTGIEDILSFEDETDLQLAPCRAFSEHVIPELKNLDTPTRAYVLDWLRNQIAHAEIALVESAQPQKEQK